MFQDDEDLEDVQVHLMERKTALRLQRNNEDYAMDRGLLMGSAGENSGTFGRNIENNSRRGRRVAPRTAHQP